MFSLFKEKERSAKAALAKNLMEISGDHTGRRSARFWLFAS